MFFVNLNGQSIIAENVENSRLLGALTVKCDKLTRGMAKAYIKARNLGALTDISYGNAVVSFREFDVLEKGIFALVEAAMVEAKKTALATIENSRLDDLLGE